ncbi:DUF6541 family protein [Specibacter sp. NPDC057265]|uniref:DUF6541 family protein n=1 Tax=Specibacter sp. NPDC057265 TaxID=3346075 RepID=UPI00362F10B7
MSWAAFIPVALTAVALLFVPGGVVAFALGLRGLHAAAVAAPLTVALSAVCAVVAGQLGLAWSILPLVIAALLLAAVLLLVRRRLASDAPEPPPGSQQTMWPWLGFSVGAGMLVWQLVRVFGEPENISQTFDGIFHLNAIQYIIDTGDASSLTLSNMTNGGNPPYFYPAAWHGLAAVLVQLTGAPVAVAANAFNMGIAAFVWTLGCMLLVRTVVGAKPWVVGFGGALAAGFSAFPLLLLDFGVLYPNFLSISLLPAGLSAVAMFFRVGQLRPGSALARFALAPLLAVGIAIAHPNGAMSLVALSVPVVLFAYLCRYIFPGHPRTQRMEARWVAGLLVIALMILGVAWKYIRPPADAAFWQRYRSPLGGAWEVATNSAMGRPVALVVSVLVVLGLYSALRKRQHWWILGCYALIASLFVVIVGFPDSYLRNALTGVWYNDSYRLAAVLPLTAVPLAALGFERLVLLGQSLLQGILGRSGRTTASAAGSAKFNAGFAVVLAASLVICIQGKPISVAVASAAQNYVESPDSEVVSSDEMALIERLGVLVPPEATVAVNPWTGAALAYALAERSTTSRHVLSTYPADIEIINNSLRNALSDPNVCPAVKATGVRYVLDFGSKEIHGGSHSFPGLENLQDSPAAELVAEVGEARLFRITACS